MAPLASGRRAAHYAFTASLVGLFCIVTGLIGFRPRQSFNFVTSSRLIPGEWFGGVLWGQVAVGLACLCVAAVMFHIADRQFAKRA